MTNDKTQYIFNAISEDLKNNHGSWDEIRHDICEKVSDHFFSKNNITIKAERSPSGVSVRVYHHSREIPNSLDSDIKELKYTLLQIIDTKTTLIKDRIYNEIIKEIHEWKKK